MVKQVKKQISESEELRLSLNSLHEILLKRTMDDMKKFMIIELDELTIGRVVEIINGSNNKIKVSFGVTAEEINSFILPSHISHKLISCYKIRLDKN